MSGTLRPSVRDGMEVMNPRDFLATARRLAASAAEADRRSAVSRAYYAVFHVAAALLRALRFGVPQADRAHGYLWLRLQNAGDPLVRGVGRLLKSLRGH